MRLNEIVKHVCRDQHGSHEGYDALEIREEKRDRCDRRLGWNDVWSEPGGYRAFIVSFPALDTVSVKVSLSSSATPEYWLTTIMKP